MRHKILPCCDHYVASVLALNGLSMNSRQKFVEKPTDHTPFWYVLLQYDQYVVGDPIPAIRESLRRSILRFPEPRRTLPEIHPVGFPKLSGQDLRSGLA